MTNSLALILGAIVVAALSLDYALADSANALFLAKKLFVLLDWLAFWR